MIFESVNKITNAKNLEDKYKIEISRLKEQHKILLNEKLEIKANTIRIIKEKDTHQNDAKELNDARTKIEKQLSTYQRSTKETITDLNNTIRKYNQDNKDLIEENTKADKQIKTLADERDKMRQRIVKLKLRKGKFDYGLKMCKFCGKEFHEKENFNWSCRTHRSAEYGGEMWWCCGKRGKDQPGCKFSKHESKEDDDEDEDQDLEMNKARQLKSIRCQCCKELGHTIENCYRDPNLKTKERAELEAIRIARLKDYRKLFADTAVTTTHFLKKLSKVPKL